MLSFHRHPAAQAASSAAPAAVSLMGDFTQTDTTVVCLGVVTYYEPCYQLADWSASRVDAPGKTPAALSCQSAPQRSGASHLRSPSLPASSVPTQGFSLQCLAKAVNILQRNSSVLQRWQDDACGRTEMAACRRLPAGASLSRSRSSLMLVGYPCEEQYASVPPPERSAHKVQLSR